MPCAQTELTHSISGDFVVSRMEVDQNATHLGYVCDGCNKRIRGVLWHCRECGDNPSTSYDLCQLCYDDGEFARHQERQEAISVDEDFVLHSVEPVRIPTHLLHEACADGNLMVVKNIIEREDAKINLKMNGSTSLAKAVIFHHPDVVDHLLSHPNIDPNAPIAETSQRPVEYAIHNGDDEMALKLLAHPRIEICRPLGYVTCFHDAAKNGMVQVFDALLSHPDAELSGADEDGVTVLHAACHVEGNVSIVKRIIKAGVHDIDVQDASGLTALHWAVHSERRDIVETLLEAGADVGIPTSDGTNPFHAAVCNNNEEITQVLLNSVQNTRCSFSPLYARDRFDHTPMYYAVAHERLRLVEIVLDAGYDVDHKEKDSEHLLHMSVRSQDLAMTKLLLDRGADCNATNAHYHTPLHLAVFYVITWRLFEQFLLLFLSHDVNLDLQGLTNPRLMVYEAALNMALTLHKPNFAGLLLRYGCQPTSSKTLAYPRISDDKNNGEGALASALSEDAMNQALDLGEYNLCEMLHAAGASSGQLLKTIRFFLSHKAASTTSRTASSTLDAETESLLSAIRRPRSLSSICRLTVRRSLNDFRPEFLKQLHVPPKLIDYLLMSDFSPVWEEEDV